MNTSDCSDTREQRWQMDSRILDIAVTNASGQKLQHPPIVFLNAHGYIVGFQTNAGGDENPLSELGDEEDDTEDSSTE